MAQRDYILRMFEEMSRVLAQVIYHRQIKDYQAAHDLIDEQLKQTFGVSLSFINSLSDETLLAMLTTMGTLNVDKCWLVAILLKASGEIYEDEQDENNSYYNYLRACNLLLETLYEQHQTKSIGPIAEIEDLLGKLEDYELPLRTRQLLFWYFEHTSRYGKAQEMLFDILEAEEGNEIENIEEVEEMLERGEAFYARLLGKSEAELKTVGFSRAEINEGLAQLHKLHV
jgi:hypothetical protein